MEGAETKPQYSCGRLSFFGLGGIGGTKHEGFGEKFFAEIGQLHQQAGKNDHFSTKHAVQTNFCHFS